MGSIFTAELWLPLQREEIFPFFANAANLEAITPPWVNFQTLTPTPIEMKPGTLIDYRIKIHGIPVKWRTRINAWEPPYRFVDEQLRGPYRKWVHEHTFEEKDGGTLCLDRVEYAVPGGWLIDKLFVRRDVGKIFAYRQERIKELLLKQKQPVGA
ncbi:MAG: SRPBCC family protein [Verrucomicrobiota bacterium]